MLNYLFAGIPIFRALLIMNIDATKLSEIMAPTRNIELNAILFHWIITSAIPTRAGDNFLVHN
jgi:hypothetical protein